MGELTDFLVWLRREKEKGKVSHETVVVVASAAFDYLVSQGKASQFPISEGHS